MQRLFRAIKKKKHKRRLVALCLFLIVIEIFLPVFHGEQTLAARSSDFPTANFKVQVANEEAENGDSTGHKFFADQTPDSGDQKICNDECLCRSEAVLGLSFLIRKSTFSRPEQTTFSAGNPIFKSLPPPYRPPEIS